MTVSTGELLRSSLFLLFSETRPNVDVLGVLEFYRTIFHSYQLARTSHAKLMLRDALQIMQAMLSNHSENFTAMGNIQDRFFESLPHYTKDLFPYKCQPEIPLHRSLEILIHSPNCQEGVKILRSIRKIYENVTVRITTPHNCHSSDILTASSEFSFWYFNRPDKGLTWLRQANLAKTEYLLVGYHLSHFSEHTNLERMLQMVCSGQANIVGGAVRSEPKGYWDLGCYQISLNNFTLRIRPGYEQSTNSCAHCDYIASPILISRRLFVRAMQHSSLPSRLALLDLFVRLIHSGLDTITLPRAVVCPDVMFHMQHDPDQALTNVDKKTWTAFVNLWSLDRIRLFPDVEFVWTCYEARIHCEFYEKSEVQVPSCCLNEQHRCVIGFLSLTSKYQITTRVSGDYLTGLYGPVIGATLYQSLLNVVWNRSAHERIEKTAFRKEFYKKYGCKLFPAHLRKPTQQIVVSGPTRNWTIYGEFMAPVSETNEIKNVYSQQTKIWVHGIWTETNYNPGTMTPEYTHWEIESLFWSAELALIPLPFCGTYQLRMNCLIASYLPLGNIQYHDVDRY
ncbi:hypothetical protein FBUS_05059 [Fasciolopsis buskii]|uniref:Uncharacterized protein n=1 Tax=Fasciolopsis buskii TaxID=27845 RepID=A0A8E0RVD0_9TREM|nr:hypothetical protein FBUS_05059 [Fasciolopsis buski]